ncbi:MAG: MBL fold metallo-hydrolase [Lachnospiraceae bacterium]|nr:MBL fold metallo-hydrolase [Lachnospiraceae bacterium]MDY5741574.1 MBL fold metallo-hydrolase [Lachnospiraceae bacterium]
MQIKALSSSSKGNCICVTDDRTTVLLDMGLAKKTTEGLLAEIDRRPQDVDAIFITHEHSDHIKGLGVFLRKYPVPVYATAGTIEGIQNSPGLGKLPYELFHVIDSRQTVVLKDWQIRAVPVLHDAREPVVYRIDGADRSVGIITDLGTYDEELVAAFQGVSQLLIEANHDPNMLLVGTYPYALKRRILGDYGHLSNGSCGSLLNRLLHDGLQGIMLGHLSEENNYAALAYETVRESIRLADTPYGADDFLLKVAIPNGLTTF